MTTLYRPVKITSAEQAEALPVGTVAHDRDHGTEPDLIPYVKVTPRFWVSVWDVSDDHELDAYGVCPNSHMVGDSALVPIEAEEEWDDKVIAQAADEMRNKIVPGSLDEIIRDALIAYHRLSGKPATPREEA